MVLLVCVEKDSAMEVLEYELLMLLTEFFLLSVLLGMLLRVTSLPSSFFRSLLKAISRSMN
jgi:hypothetical protein